MTFGRRRRVVVGSASKGGLVLVGFDPPTTGVGCGVEAPDWGLGDAKGPTLQSVGEGCKLERSSDPSESPAGPDLFGRNRVICFAGGGINLRSRKEKTMRE